MNVYLFIIILCFTITFNYTIIMFLLILLVTSELYCIIQFNLIMFYFEIIVIIYIYTSNNSCADYCTNAPYIGCMVGRVANRIKDSVFSLDGKDHHVSSNDPPNHLHGGFVGFNKVLKV